MSPVAAMWSLGPLLPGLLLVLSCGGEEPVEMAPATIATLPVMTPCPAGWSEVERSEGLVECEPWSDGAAPACGAYELPMPGEGCVSLGATCPADGVPVGLPSDRPVRLVRAGASGSHTFPTIAEALVDAAPGTVIAVAAGRYAEAVRLPAGVSLIGACPEDTVIAAPAGTDPVGAIQVTGEGVEILDLRIEGERPGIVVETGSATVRSVIIDRTPGFGIRVQPATSLVAQDVLVRDTYDAVAEHGEHARGLGVLGERDATLDIERCAFIGNAGAAVWAGSSFEDMVHAQLRNVYARGGLVGIGGLSTETTVSVETALVEDATIGLLAWGATVTGRDIYLHDATHRAGAPAASGFANVGGYVDMSRLVLRRAVDVGVLSMTRGQGELRDVIVRDTQIDPTDMLGGRGVTVESGGTMRLVRALVEKNVELGVSAFNPGSRIEFQDLTVRETLTSPRIAVAMGAYDEGEIDGSRFLLAESALVGIQLARDGAMDLHEGEIVRNEIGANVQVPGYDLARISEGVRYRDNAVNLDAEELPLPNAAIP